MGDETPRTHGRGSDGYILLITAVDLVPQPAASDDNVLNHSYRISPASTWWSDRLRKTVKPAAVNMA